MLPDVHYATLADGTPVLGMYDNDNTPFIVRIDWQGIALLTDGTNEISLPRCDDMNFAAWGRLRELVTSGVVEELLPIARRFLAEPPRPLAPVQMPPELDEPDAIALWHKLTPFNQALLVELLSECRDKTDAEITQIRDIYLTRHPQFA